MSNPQKKIQAKIREILLEEAYEKWRFEPEYERCVKKLVALYQPQEKLVNCKCSTCGMESKTIIQHAAHLEMVHHETVTLASLGLEVCLHQPQNDENKGIPTQKIYGTGPFG